MYVKIVAALILFGLGALFYHLNIQKLNGMDVNIGYPEEMLNDFSGIKYDNNKDFFQNMLAIKSEAEKAWKFAAGKKFNKKAWGAIMSAATVNACYVPGQNSINFPAAILRKPFYDKDATLAFFIADATCWRRLLTKNVVQEKLKTDYHAPDFLRVNVNVSQFDKFYETFDIKEGDRMYTKPEDRLSVW